MTKRITMATIKSFIKKNSEELFLKKINSYDGMCDGVNERAAHGFTQVEFNHQSHANQLGIPGAWFTPGGNLLTEYNDGVFKGFDVYNCCGHFIIAVK
jgi:hypothetical protein